jgi:uncharacterized protein YukE
MTDFVRGCEEALQTILQCADIMHNANRDISNMKGRWRGDNELEFQIKQLKQQSDVLSNSCTKLGMVSI